MRKPLSPLERGLIIERAQRAKALFWALSLVLFLSIVLVAGCVDTAGEKSGAEPVTAGASAGELPAAEPAVTVVPRDAETVRLSFAPLVKAAAPAVVSITSTRRAASARGGDPFFDDPFFRHFFGDLSPFGRGRQQERRQTALGSGVIVGADGLIVTNHHVVEGADAITVILADRTEHRAELVTSDERSDLAFLRIAPGRPLPVVPLGDSDRIEVGDLVLAIGNPFGIGQTVTSGIVSAQARATPGVRSDVSFIQTDAAINPGNSGGALISMDGELVGVNTAIFTRGGGSIGIGFAIPANLVAARVAGLERGVDSGRPWLGAAYAPIDTGIAKALDLARPQGLLIERVHARGAAAEAGLRPGDVVMAIDGVEVSDAPALNLRLQLKPLGDSVALAVLRRGEPLQLELPLRPAPAEPAADQRVLTGNQPLSGAVVANLSPAFNESLGIDPFAVGVGIVEMQPRSFVARLRLRHGDIVHSVNGNPVRDVAALVRLLEEPQHRWVIAIERGGQIFDVTIG